MSANCKSDEHEEKTRFKPLARRIAFEKKRALQFQYWLKTFEKQLALCGHTQSFSALTAGRAREKLLELIYDACEGLTHKSELRDCGKYARRDYIRGARNLANSLRRSVALLTAIQAEKGEVPGIDHLALPCLIDLNTLERCAELAEEFLEYRLYSLSIPPYVSRHSDASLFQLWAYVRITTGTDHYRELADLIQAGKYAIDGSSGITEDALKKRIPRFVRTQRSQAEDIFNSTVMFHAVSRPLS